jgi:hypothetical protein
MLRYLGNGKLPLPELGSPLFCVLVVYLKILGQILFLLLL